MCKDLPNDRPGIQRGFGPAQFRKPFVDGPAHHVRQRHAALAKRLHLSDARVIQPHDRALAAGRLDTQDDRVIVAASPNVLPVPAAAVP